MPKRKQNASVRSPFSERLKYLRKQKGINMEQLAQRVSVSKSYISLLESGGRQPSRDVVLKLVQALFAEENGNARDELLILAGFAPQKPQNSAVYRDLIDIYQHHLAIDPMDFKTFTYLILSYIKSGKYEKAQEQIQVGFKTFSESIQLQCLLSNLELSRQHYDGAILNQKTAIENFKQIVPKPEGIKLGDLLFNLGEIFFMQGYDYLAKHYQDTEKELKQKSIQSFLNARGYFEKALKASSDNVYILDECARLAFNLAFLATGKEAKTYWNETTSYFEAVFQSSDKHLLGQLTLAESACFLAHAHGKLEHFSIAELTLGLVNSFHSDYWLVHYIQTCIKCLQFQADPREVFLDQALSQLALATEHPSSENRAKQEALSDPDLEVLRTHRSTAFQKIVNKGDMI